MEFKELNKKRHAVKIFDGKRVPTVDVKQMISSAVLAPSAHNLQPWLFVIVESNESRALLANETNSTNRQQLENAGALVVLFSDTDLSARARELAQAGRSELPDEVLGKLMSHYPKTFENYSVQYMSDYLALNSGIVTMNFLYAVKNMGYEGNTILGFHKSAKINESLNIPLRYRPELIFAIGTSEEKGQPHFGFPPEKFFEIR